MNQRPTSRFQKKPRSRYGFLVFCFVSLLAAFTILRVVMLANFGPPSTPPWNVLLAFAAGFYRDVIAALWFMLPPLFWCFVAGNPRAVNLELTPHPTPKDLELEKNAGAIFQVADELYMNRRHHLDP